MGVAGDNRLDEQIRQRARESIEATGERFAVVFDSLAARLGDLQGDLRHAATYQRVSQATESVSTPVC